MSAEASADASADASGQPSCVSEWWSSSSPRRLRPVCLGSLITMSLSEKQEQESTSTSKVESLVPKVKAEEEEEEEEEDLIDPAVDIKKACSESHCMKYKDRFDACTERVTSRAGKTEETCLEEILDLYHCIDHCAADKLFKQVK